MVTELLVSFFHCYLYVLIDDYTWMRLNNWKIFYVFTSISLETLCLLGINVFYFIDLFMKYDNCLISPTM